MPLITLLQELRFWQGDCSNAGGLLKAACVVLFGVTQRWQRSERCQRCVKKRYLVMPSFTTGIEILAVRLVE